MPDPVVEAIRQTEACNRKLAQIAETFLKRTTPEAERAKRISNAASTVQWKFTVSCVHLEELWRLSEAARLTLPALIENAAESHKWDQRDLLDGTRHLEAFLFQARAFIDVFMRMACEVLAVHPPVLMSTESFQKALKNVVPGSSKRAANLQAYFDEHVFGQRTWGTLVRALRDKVAHRDELRPSQGGQEHVAGVQLDWPTITGISYERLAQDFHNGAFELLRSTSVFIFELPWYSGPYRANAFDAG